nr:aminotransferase class I/II-fold pyridoxal phosphate-dependent enzyme [Motilibacter deserti]
MPASRPARNYSDAAGAPVQADLARVARTALDGAGVPAEHVTCTSGALDAIERTLLAHLRPGDRVAVEDPGWPSLLDLLAATGLVADPVAVDDEGPRAEGLTAALRRGARAVVVTARAQNPTGAAISPARAQLLRQVLAAAPGALVVEDDHGAGITGAALQTLAGATDAWAHVRSASKASGPDLRCAVLAGDATTVARVTGRLRLGPGWVSHLLQEATARAWGAPGFGSATAVYDARRQALLDELAARGVGAAGRTGLNVWVPVPDEAAVVSGLLARGVAAAPGSRFRLSAAPGVRLTSAALAVEDAPGVAAAVAEVLRPRAYLGV